MFAAVFTYSYKKRYCRSQRLQNFFSCSIALVNTLQFSVNIAKAFFPLLEMEKCMVFRIIQITSIAISRIMAHLFFNDRLKGANFYFSLPCYGC